MSLENDALISYFGHAPRKFPNVGGFRRRLVPKAKVFDLPRLPGLTPSFRFYNKGGDHLIVIPADFSVIAKDL